MIVVATKMGAAQDPERVESRRRMAKDAIVLHLIENDPLAISRNKFVLKRPSLRAARELRTEQWRVFYKVTDDGQIVIVNLIGEKRGNKLVTEGEEFEI